MLWGLHVVIPEKYCVRRLDDLYQEHHGICPMKSLAWGYFWWPGLDTAIVERVQQNVIFVLPWASPLQGNPWKWAA